MNGALRYNFDSLGTEMHGLVSTSWCPLETEGRTCVIELAPGQALACSGAESH